MCTACKHETPKGMAYDHSICLDCYSIFTDTRWGVASLKWFRNRDAAEFYRATGRYPDGDDPRDAEISSLTVRVEELERALSGVVDCLTVYVKKEAEHPYCDPCATIRGVNELAVASKALGTAVKDRGE